MPPNRHRDDSPSTQVALHLSHLDMARHDTPTTRKRPADMAEINETSGVYDKVMPSPSPSPTNSNSPTPNNPTSPRGRFVLHPPRRVTSPPPPTPIASPNLEDEHDLFIPTAIKIAQDKLSALRCDSPTNPTEDDTCSQDENMTWQQDEITGHHIDHTADDDGEGINGIGFIPTPAIVTKRSEWRARESREARQRRYDKRKTSQRDSAISLDEGGSFKRRMVRFAEA
ncbi:hypothetical protein E4T52_04047 [Aureobasidium sp. EXF-3400]|nr:hypothetical protein E4T51_12501 [Aureobasidium sp. EXF-12344]KAI4781017.1 hypothetical protein E4T52_04047 [Aureobasidium sp. EXF-3400]